MATTSKTTKGKSTSTKTVKATTPKPLTNAKEAPVQPVGGVQFTPAAAPPVQAPAKPLEHVDSEFQAEQAIASMNTVLRDEERVIIRTPHDPFNQSKLFERSINGLVIVLFADELYSLPKSIAKAIKKQVRIQEISDMTHEEFTTKNGKFIG